MTKGTHLNRTNVQVDGTEYKIPFHELSSPTDRRYDVPFPRRTGL